MGIIGPPVVLLAFGEGLNSSALLIALRNGSGNGHIWSSWGQIQYVSKATSGLCIYMYTSRTHWLPAHSHISYRSPHMHTVSSHTPPAIHGSHAVRLVLGRSQNLHWSTALYFITNTWHFCSPPLASACLLSVSPERLRCPHCRWAV